MTDTITPTGCPVAHTAAHREQHAGKHPFDPFGDAYQHDPAAATAVFREEQPVFYDEALGYWVVTRYEDVRAVFRDHETFSPRIALEKITPTTDEATEVLKTYDFGLDRTLVNEDEPAHMARRRALMGSFAPEHLAEHEEMVRRLTREAVDAFIDEGRADLVTQLLYWIPLNVAFHFLGVPEDDMATLKRFSVAHTVNTWGRPTPEQQVDVAHNVGQFWQYAGQVLERIRQDPDAPGWMPFSVRAQAEQPEVVTDSYLHSMMMAGIVAAHETTAHASANMVKLLLEHRAVWDEVCANPALIANTVEECLRHAGSVAAWRRLALRDTQVGGVAIPEGAKLLIVSASANHDERHFTDADTVDPRRESAAEHLTFGYGVHQCLGKNLARMEMQVFLEELTTRLPHLELDPDQEFSYVPNTSFRGPEHLWVEWDPTANPERTNPGILDRHRPITIGEPSKGALSRTLRVESVTPLTDEVRRVRLVDPTGRALPRWTSGAHIDLDCGEDEDGLRSRQYSLCGDPSADHLEIAVLREDAGRGGSAWVHAELTEGAQVTVRGPRNHFGLDDGDGPLVLVAGGIGITPVLAHADAAKAAGRDYRVHYLGRSRSTMAYLDRLERDHGERVSVHAADEGQRADLSALLTDLPEGTRVYACGPQRLLDALTELAANWSEDTLRLEHFTSTLGALDPEVEHAFTVELEVSGQTLEVAADTTVLDTLRAAGVDVPSDCEEGLCGSCEVPVLSGEVDHRDVVLAAAERRAGRSMMTCCSRACGDRLVLDL
ncbi:cytochrome P450/oxidoreductase [Kytococcus sedentarius]|uniref:Cytochrome P450 n=1 Tax=Kytococcus sedentarius (strain ATCC 14392 / DSM 20547 / JCM 11482 / CCUG 33030 / NBRC 15357 / NCTC 11040 / CCM 314 / 541) TaxID=478801 RepID=C7NLX7_KYTSD|nr:cytochrome P450/oxidoreductase [Kytococcus sedentarius]ACV07226.1 cytochrome P450 [Kytococcus sedentarius DSM 20547]QQB63194.1 cytochrome P450/oxidoreductase [Kytococcus sedentarius]STX13939.1 Cytochrome P450 116 [Kytococcus sedentarius]